MLSVKLTKAEKAQFDEHKLEFVSNVIKSADEKGKPLILDPRKAMEALDNSHLRELVDFLRGKKHAVSGDYT
jgi:hypothetical protein